jgi:hypothetical protein
VTFLKVVSGHFLASSGTFINTEYEKDDCLMYEVS